MTQTARLPMVTCDGCGAELTGLAFLHVVMRYERPAGNVFSLDMSRDFPGDYCNDVCLLRRLARNHASTGFKLEELLTKEAPITNPPQTPPREGWIRKGGVSGPPTSARPSPLPGIPKEVGP